MSGGYLDVSVDHALLVTKANGVDHWLDGVRSFFFCVVLFLTYAVEELISNNRHLSASHELEDDEVGGLRLEDFAELDDVRMLDLVSGRLLKIRLLSRS